MQVAAAVEDLYRLELQELVAQVVVEMEMMILLSQHLLQLLKPTVVAAVVVGKEEDLVVLAALVALF
jgi:hypothetical protein